jgi:3-oxoacyl-[acyl-carrier protein] reductase
MDKMMKALNGQTAIITGASRGIGAAIALRLAQSGADIIINYRYRADLAGEVVNGCESLGVNAIAIQGNVGQRESVESLFERVLTGVKSPISILVNNAGISHYGLITKATEEEWDEVMNVHLKGAFLMSQSALQHMIPNRYGRIINISSIWGLTGSANEVIYSTAKGGLHTFTKALAKEVAPSGITVNAVAPGVIDTDMLRELEQEDRNWVEAQIPMGRFGHPDDVASMVNYLSLPESSYITGQIVGVHGGWIGSS